MNTFWHDENMNKKEEERLRYCRKEKNNQHLFHFLFVCVNVCANVAQIRINKYK